MKKTEKFWVLIGLSLLCLVVALVLLVCKKDDPPVPPVVVVPSPTVTETFTPVPPTETVVPPTNTPVHPTHAPETGSRQVIVTWFGEFHRGGPFFCEEFGFFDPGDPTTVAMGAGGPPCGTKVRLCSESTCIVAVIKDKCGGCGPGHLDLSRAAWDTLGQPERVLMTILE